MSKIIIIPSNLDMIKNTLNKCDGYIIGIKNMCENAPISFCYEEVLEIYKLLGNDQELFISLNKNFSNDELIDLEDMLTKLSELNISGVLFYDIAVVEIVKRLNLKINLVWSQEHFTTNPYSANYWYKEGSKYTLLSNEITIDEIENFKNNCSSKLMLQVFGYVSMFVSKRKLVDNYKKYFEINDNSSIYYLEKENYTYPVIESHDSTIVYSYSPINSIKDMSKLNELIDYAILNSFLIDEDEFIKIVDKYKNNELFDSLYNETFFLHKESIYRVKK